MACRHPIKQHPNAGSVLPGNISCNLSVPQAVTATIHRQIRPTSTDLAERVSLILKVRISNAQFEGNTNKFQAKLCSLTWQSTLLMCSDFSPQRSFFTQQTAQKPPTTRCRARRSLLATKNNIKMKLSRQGSVRPANRKQNSGCPSLESFWPANKWQNGVESELHAMSWRLIENATVAKVLTLLHRSPPTWP